MVGRSLKVKPMLLLGLITILVLSAAILASARSGEVPFVGKALNLTGGTASDALAAGEAQMGKPFKMSTDGPNTFSCSGWNQSFFGDLHVQGVEGVLFYTRQKCVLSRWDSNYVRQHGW